MVQCHKNTVETWDSFDLIFTLRKGQKKSDRQSLFYLTHSSSEAMNSLLKCCHTVAEKSAPWIKCNVPQDNNSQLHSLPASETNQHEKQSHTSIRAQSESSSNREREVINWSEMAKSFQRSCVSVLRSVTHLQFTKNSVALTIQFSSCSSSLSYFHFGRLLPQLDLVFPEPVSQLCTKSWSHPCCCSPAYTMPQLFLLLMWC